MDKKIEQALNKLQKQEEHLMAKKTATNPMKDQLLEKIPLTVQKTLEQAFVKAFELVFLHGRELIEKSFDREERMNLHEVNNYLLSKKVTTKNIRRLGQGIGKSNLLNNTATVVSGFGLGLLGVGLPDIPLLVGTILRGIYLTALDYGFDYTQKTEQIYILRLIRTAVCTDIRKEQYYRQLTQGQYPEDRLQEEIASTATLLSEELLLEKFIQGIPIIGVIGGVVNHQIYRKVSSFAALQYKKRYLLQK